MSKMLPQETVDSLRNNVDISLEMYGIPVDLYVPNNLDSIASKDAFQMVDEIVYDLYEDTNVFINWNPNMYRLRNYGLYVEGQLPITAFFPGLEDIDVIRKSYIVVPIQYVPNETFNTNEFEVSDLLPGPMQELQVRQEFKLVPRRVTS